MPPFFILALAGAQIFADAAFVQKPAQVTAAVSVGSSLPEDYSKLLHDVKLGVEHLKIPGAQQNIAPHLRQPLTDCSFIGSLVSAKLTQRCCTSIQVVTQHQLSEYGLAGNCPVGWDCEADGKTPLQAFEARSLSELCGEPGCLPRVTKAFKSNWKTAAGASQMSKICARLGQLSGDSSATLISGLLHDDRPSTKLDMMRPGTKWDDLDMSQQDDRPGNKPLLDVTQKKPKFMREADEVEQSILHGEVPGPLEEPKPTHDKDDVLNHCKKLCAHDLERKEICNSAKPGAAHHNCYDTCGCDSLACFPGEAMVTSERSGVVPLGDIRVGDRIQVERFGKLLYEPVLAFLHALRPQNELPFLTVQHARGEFRASSTHLVFVVSKGGGSESKLVGNVEVGDQLLVASGIVDTPLVSSRIFALQHSYGSLGMFAPLTASGTVVVDGVVASNYASPSPKKHLSHHHAHAFLFPVRIYHQLGFAAFLKPLWDWLCPSGRSADKTWFCQGAGIEGGAGVTEAEDLHPFLAIMYKGLKADSLLPTLV